MAIMNKNYALMYSKLHFLTSSYTCTFMSEIKAEIYVMSETNNKFMQKLILKRSCLLFKNKHDCEVAELAGCHL